MLRVLHTAANGHVVLKPLPRPIVDCGPLRCAESWLTRILRVQYAWITYTCICSSEVGLNLIREYGRRVVHGPVRVHSQCEERSPLLVIVRPQNFDVFHNLAVRRLPFEGQTVAQQGRRSDKSETPWGRHSVRVACPTDAGAIVAGASSTALSLSLPAQEQDSQGESR